MKLVELAIGQQDVTTCIFDARFLDDLRTSACTLEPSVAFCNFVVDGALIGDTTSAIFGLVVSQRVCKRSDEQPAKCSLTHAYGSSSTVSGEGSLRPAWRSRSRASAAGHKVDA